MTKEELEQKFNATLKEKGSLLATEDGQVFNNDAHGKAFAQSYASGKGLKVIELKYSEKKAEPKKAAKKTTKK